MSIQTIEIKNRDHWLRLRKQDITGSDVGPICGYPLYRSRAHIWAEKLDLVDPVQETGRMKVGRWYEAAGFEALTETFPDWQFKRTPQTLYLRDPEFSLGSTPDGFARDPENRNCSVEIKNALPEIWLRDWCGGNEGSPAVPPMAHQLQTLQAAMLSDSAYGLLVALINNYHRDMELRTFVVPRDADVERLIREHVAAFRRDYLLPKICPPLDPHFDSEIVRKLHPEDDGTEIDLRGDNRIVELVDRRAELKSSVKVASDEVEGLEVEIKEKLGAHRYGRLADGRIVSWKREHREEYVVKAHDRRVLRVSKR